MPYGNNENKRDAIRGIPIEITKNCTRERFYCV